MSQTLKTIDLEKKKGKRAFPVYKTNIKIYSIIIDCVIDCDANVMSIDLRKPFNCPISLKLHPQIIYLLFS